MGEKATILARRTKGAKGEASVTITITDAKKKTSRRKMAKFDAFEAAVSAVRKVERDALKKGWKKSAFKIKRDVKSRHGPH